MSVVTQSPARIKILAAIAWAAAWGPPLAAGRMFFPLYHRGAISIPFGDLVVAFSFWWAMAGAILLITLTGPDGSLPAGSRRIVVATLAGMVTGGVTAALVACGMGFSLHSVALMLDLDVWPLGYRGPEPFLSAGLIIGITLAIIIALGFSGIARRLSSASRSSVRIVWDVSLRMCLIAVAIRLAGYTIASSSFFQYGLLGGGLLDSNSSASGISLVVSSSISDALFGLWSSHSLLRLQPEAVAKR